MRFVSSLSKKTRSADPSPQVWRAQPNPLPLSPPTGLAAARDIQIPSLNPTQRSKIELRGRHSLAILLGKCASKTGAQLNTVVTSKRRISDTENLDAPA